MSTTTNVAKQAVHDKIESQIKIAQSKLETLKARAESAKATAELKVITELLTKKAALDRQVGELKKSADASYEKTKDDVQGRVAELEKSVQAIEARLKTA